MGLLHVDFCQQLVFEKLGGLYHVNKENPAACMREV
jgi:hypothetical protein